ncbi:MAG TPA: hypothetical protein VH108_11790 [Gaiellaceae bacterium]|nr:hypothetical protein [Gaiellaceae bacterium]
MTARVDLSSLLSGDLETSLLLGLGAGGSCLLGHPSLVLGEVSCVRGDRRSLDAGAGGGQQLVDRVTLVACFAGCG